MARTPEQIQQAGLEALRKELGREGMIRFLQHYETGSGDYSRERHALLKDLTLNDIRAASRLDQKARKPRRS